MNLTRGGQRALLVLLILQILVVGGITVGAAFFEAAPIDLPYPAKYWPESLLGAGVAALLFTYVAFTIVHPPAETPSVPEFAVSLWGMASAFMGWFVGTGCVFASAGGWDQMGTWFFRNFVGTAIPTAVAIGLIWLAPIIVLGFLAWLWDGFTSKQDGATSIHRLRVFVERIVARLLR